jgi:hypothetical protein
MREQAGTAKGAKVKSGIRDFNGRRNATEPTVEGVLAELREMFPDAGFISVKRQEYIDLREQVSWTCNIHVDGFGWSPEPTLELVMAQVRQWHKENKRPNPPQRESFVDERAYFVALGQYADVASQGIGESQLTEADRRALERLPDGDWFSIHEVSYMVRCPRYRCDRLVEKGALEWRVTGEYPHLESEYKKL